MQGLGGDGSERVDGLQVMGEVPVAEMQDRALQATRLSTGIQDYLVVGIGAAPVAATPIEQAQFPVRPEQTAAHDLAQILVAAGHLITCLDRTPRLQRQQLRAELRTDPFVRIQTEHPIVTRQVDRELLLLPMTGKWRVDLDARATGGCDLAAAIAAATVQDQDLLAEVQRAQTVLDPIRFLVTDHAGGDRYTSLRVPSTFRPAPHPWKVRDLALPGSENLTGMTAKETVTSQTPKPTPTREYSRLVAIIAQLRAPGGCPWDREQSELSMAPHLLEETYEALAAIEAGDPSEICEELGDVLMNVLMISQIASETKGFHHEDVAREIADKLVRRHPHVFADAVAEDSQTVLSNWEAIKLQEKGSGGANKTTLAGVPRALPALLKAYRIGEKAGRRGFDWPDMAGPRAKIDEELAELDQALAGDDEERIADELGDLLFAIVNLARHQKINPEMALRGTVERFMSRFAHVESALGEGFAEASLEQMERLWQEAKQAEDRR